VVWYVVCSSPAQKCQWGSVGYRGGGAHSGFVQLHLPQLILAWLGLAVSNALANAWLDREGVACMWIVMFK
jgi:hypothetical protein